MIAAIIEKLLIYGPNAAIAIGEAFQKGSPSVDDIKALTITKDPEDYFK